MIVKWWIDAKLETPIAVQYKWRYYFICLISHLKVFGNYNSTIQEMLRWQDKFRHWVTWACAGDWVWVWVQGLRRYIVVAESLHTPTFKSFRRHAMTPHESDPASCSPSSSPSSSPSIHRIGISRSHGMECEQRVPLFFILLYFFVCAVKTCLAERGREGRKGEAATCWQMPGLINCRYLWTVSVSAALYLLWLGHCKICC